ncbi:MAG: SDR family oxidoreductase [Anaerolineales bacterium]|jgi:pteridine reductase
MPTENPVALVTGAAHRVGRAIAAGLSERGYRIMLHYNQAQEEARETAGHLTARGTDVALHQADLTDLQQIEALFNHAAEHFERLDVLVNSAAIMRRMDFDHVNAAEWADSIDLNLRAPFFCTQQAARIMKQNGGGVVINISDIAARQPWPRFPVHSISKAGLEMLTRVAAAYLAPEIRVNGIAPGPVLKPEGMSEDRWQKLGAALPLGRTGTPHAVVEAVLFLIENNEINGEILAVDGGNQLL